MVPDLTSFWPSWGSTGTQPSDGTDYAAGDNVKAGTLDHLWYHIDEAFTRTENWISNHDGATTGVHGVGGSTVASTADITNHENDSDAHHARPTATQSTDPWNASTVDYFADGDGSGASNTYDPDTVPLNGFTMNVNDCDVTINFYDGTSYSTGGFVDTTITKSYSQPKFIDSISIDFPGGSGNVDLDVDLLYPAGHTHNI